MDFLDLLNTIPATVAADIQDFSTVTLKTGGRAVRVTLDRLLTDAEKADLSHVGCVGVDCVARHRYAPEIQKSYFYAPGVKV